MCSYGNNNKRNLNIYLGWYGCYLELDNFIYNPQNNKSAVGDSVVLDKEEMIKKIKNKFTYTEFINSVLECIENGGET